MKEYRILIIDDEIEIINTIIECLEPDYPNYIFYQATTGVIGINVAEEYNPNLIITDWEMPGMSGIQTIKQLKSSKTTKNIPVIMLTGIMTSSTNLKTAFEAGAIDFIRKPIDVIELTARIHSMLLFADSHKKVVDMKNRELASTAMNIVQNNEFNIKLYEELQAITNEFKPKNKKLSQRIEQLIKSISTKIKGEAWTHFETYFEKVHPDFFNGLRKQFPDITPAELKLAAFLRLNMTTKEIASITFLTVDSVKNARTRLRKRLQLSPDENIVTFLMEF